METFAKLFELFLVFVYHCFDRIVIQGYRRLLAWPEHIVTPQILAMRTAEYRGWIEA